MVVTDIDKYYRIVGIIYVDNKCLNELLLENGYAWVYSQYCKEERCKLCRLKEEVARRQKKGLWADSDPTPPWDYRKAKRDRSYKPGRVSTAPFHGNITSKVFHRIGCQYYNCKNCREDFKTARDAEKRGYRACGVCRP